MIWTFESKDYVLMKGAPVVGNLYEITLTFIILLERIFAATNSRKQYTPHYKTYINVFVLI